MRRLPVWLCCWPGLPRLWLQGDGYALALALVSGLALNALVVASLPGLDFLTGASRVGAMFAFAGWWLFWAIRSYRGLAGFVEQRVSESGNVDEKGVDDRGLFIQAQGEYLRGNWFEAESLLKQALRHSYHDVDSHFLLATLYRRTRRYAEAAAQLRELAQQDRADKWRWELRAERRALSQLAVAEGTISVAGRATDRPAGADAA
ncbi:MAG: tetratricopeptide repeat protein [Pirellulaceae bacterium]